MLVELELAFKIDSIDILLAISASSFVIYPCLTIKFKTVSLLS